MTQPFDFKQRQSIVPRWEELLLFNDNFETVFEMEKNKNVVMFFEIIDFLPMSVANKNYNRYGQKGKYFVSNKFLLDNLYLPFWRRLVQNRMGVSKVSRRWLEKFKVWTESQIADV